MKKVLAFAALIGGIVSILSGVEQMLVHFSDGTLFANDNLLFKQAWGLIMAGSAGFMPGLQSLKVGVFARADQLSNQATAVAVPEQITVPPIPPVVPPAAAGLLIFFLLLAPLNAHAFSRFDCESPASWAKGNAIALGSVAEGIVTLGTMGTPTLFQLTTSDAGAMPVAAGWAAADFIGFGISWLHAYFRLGGSVQGTIQMTSHLFCFDPFV